MSLVNSEKQTKKKKELQFVSLGEEFFCDKENMDEKSERTLQHQFPLYLGLELFLKEKKRTKNGKRRRSARFVMVGILKLDKLEIMPTWKDQYQLE